MPEQGSLASSPAAVPAAASVLDDGIRGVLHKPSGSSRHHARTVMTPAPPLCTLIGKGGRWERTRSACRDRQESPTWHTARELAVAHLATAHGGGLIGCLFHRAQHR